MHVVIAKPLHAFARHASTQRDAQLLLDEFGAAADIERMRLAARAGDGHGDDRDALLEGRDIEHLRGIDEDILVVSVLEADQRHPSLLSRCVAEI
jgi:hypothetical protein